MTLRKAPHLTEPQSCCTQLRTSMRGTASTAMTCAQGFGNVGRAQSPMLTGTVSSRRSR